MNVTYKGSIALPAHLIIGTQQMAETNMMVAAIFIRTLVCIKWVKIQKIFLVKRLILKAK